MDEHRKALLQLQLEQCKKALEDHHIKTYIAQDRTEAKQLISGMIEDHTTVCDGGSMTLKESGVIAMLQKRNIHFRTHNDPTLSREESDKEARLAFSADTFLCSSNAITMNGELINVDGHGNRVSAMIFGPKQVIILAGYNKLVEDEEAARRRISAIAAPANCIRLQKQTPCRKTTVCMDCHSTERICSSYVKINYDKEDRLRVILVKEEFGY